MLLMSMTAKENMDRLDRSPVWVWMPISGEVLRLVVEQLFRSAGLESVALFGP